MNTEQKEQQSLRISQEKLLAFVHTMIAGNRGLEDDEHPLPPGPWDPAIRTALERIGVFGPQPEPWFIGRAFAFPLPWKVIMERPREIWGAIGGFGEEVALNPQPLPPRYAFLVSAAQTMVSRAELLQEMADATRREGVQHGSISYIARFVDEYCLVGKPKWPFPGPPPHWWFASEFDGMDLLVMASQFEQAAKQTFSPGLRQILADANAKLVEAGLSKMQ